MRVNYSYQRGASFETWGERDIKFLDKSRVKMFNKVFTFEGVVGPYAVYRRNNETLKISERDRMAGTAKFKPQAQVRETTRAFPNR